MRKIMTAVLTNDGNLLSGGILSMLYHDWKNNIKNYFIIQYKNCNSIYGNLVIVFNYAMNLHICLFSFREIPPSLTNQIIIHKLDRH